VPCIHTLSVSRGARWGHRAYSLGSCLCRPRAPTRRWFRKQPTTSGCTRICGALKRSGPAIIFQLASSAIAGAALGAACFAAVDLKALALPVALSLLALAMGLGVKHDVTN